MGPLTSLAMSGVASWLLFAGAAEVYARNFDAVVLVEAEGEMFNGDREKAVGSGFAISQNGLVLTNAHVILEQPTNYRNHTVRVRRLSRSAPPIRATVVSIDSTNDLALLQTDPTALPTFSQLGDSAPIQAGEPVYVMGFPLDIDLSIVDGIVSNRSLANRWYTTLPMNPGNSGGPVFDSRGLVIGVALGGVVYTEVNGVGRVPVEGIKYFVPINLFHEGIGKGQAVVERAAPSSVAPEVSRPSLLRSYAVSEVKDDHPGVVPTSREYVKRFDAETGYVITDANVIELSANFTTGKSHEIVEGGRAVVVRFTLRSGPFFDRYRGWYHADLQTTQKLIGRTP